MIFSFPVIVNLELLATCHEQAIVELWDCISDKKDPNNYVTKAHFDWYVKNINDNEEVEKSRTKIDSFKQVLSENGLSSHFDNLLYLFYLFTEYSMGWSIKKEEYLKSAGKSIANLISLLDIKSSFPATDLSITIMNKGGRVKKVIFDMPVIVDSVWENLCEALISSSLNMTINPVIDKQISPDNLSVQSLIETKKQIRVKTGAFYSKALAELAEALRYYLNTENILKGNTDFSSSQARLIFDLFEAFDFLYDSKISSEKDDYIRTLMKNNRSK